MTARVLIVGYGFVGQILGKALKKDGHLVFAIKRKPISHEINRLILKDILELQDQDLPDVDFVIYCPSSDARDIISYQTIYARGIKVIASIYKKRSHKPRLIYASSSRVFEQNHGQWVSEDSPCRPKDPLSSQILDGETTTKESELDPIIVRFSGIYGINRHPLLDALQKGNVNLCNSLHFSNRIHVHDCARVLYHMMRIKYNEHLYIASDCEPTPINTIVSWLSATTGLPLPENKHDSSPDPNDFKSNKRLNNTRLLHTGFRFEFPNYRQGFKDILQQKGLLPPA